MTYRKLAATLGVRAFNRIFHNKSFRAGSKDTSLWGLNRLFGNPKTKTLALGELERRIENREVTAGALMEYPLFLKALAPFAKEGVIKILLKQFGSEKNVTILKVVTEEDGDRVQEGYQSYMEEEICLVMEGSKGKSGYAKIYMEFLLEVIKLERIALAAARTINNGLVEELETLFEEARSLADEYSITLDFQRFLRLPEEPLLLHEERIKMDVTRGGSI